MSDIMIKFGDDMGAMLDAERHLDYMFCTSPREFARQSHAEVVVSCMNGQGAQTVRSDDIRDLAKVKDAVIKTMRTRGLFAPGALGRFDIVIPLDGIDYEGFDAAVRLVGLLLLQYSEEHQTFIAFALHLAQRKPGGGFEPPHFHVIWQRNGQSADAVREALYAEFCAD